MQDLTTYTTGELSMMVMNDESLYTQRHNLTREQLAEMFVFTDEQWEELQNDLQEEQFCTITLQNGDVLQFEADEVDSFGEEGANLYQIETTDGQEWVVGSRSAAENYVRDHYSDMAENRPNEIKCYFSDEQLISMALGQVTEVGGQGYTVRNLQEWIDLSVAHCEEEIASYDGEEHAIQTENRNALEALDMMSNDLDVAYRVN